MSEFCVPSAVEQVGRRLIESERNAFLVGPGLRDLLSGIAPSHFELSTDAAIDEILERFSNGVLIGERRDTVMVPSPAGPVDVSSYRMGIRIDDDLAHRDFTINAVAYDIADRKWIDPHGGRADLARGLIRAVGRARDRIAEDPIRALRAIRLAATRGWKLDPELEDALGTARPALAKTPREPVRRELIAILLSEGAARALERLDRSQLSADLAPGAAPGAGALLDRLPRDLDVRLAGWLRGTAARGVLQRLRFSPPVVDRVDLLLRYHGTDARLRVLGPAAAIRFARRVGVHNLTALIALRESEAEALGETSDADRDTLIRLREALAILRDSERKESARSGLAVTGTDVMQCLGCGPGPRVGRAIAYLAERVRRNPALNSPDGLRSLLRDWVDDTGAP